MDTMRVLRVGKHLQSYAIDIEDIHDFGGGSFRINATSAISPSF